MNNNKKAEQLGMPWGTANNRLRKKILFNLLLRYKENICFQCKKEINTEKELSIEHKKPWLDNGIELFWDLDNIAFSHLSCNCATGRKHNKGKKSPHGILTRYTYSGCRCEKCKKANTDNIRERRRAGLMK